MLYIYNENGRLVTSEAVSALSDLDNVNISSPADNEILAFDNGTSLWINQTAAESGLATSSDLTNHINDSSDAHDASAISFSATGNIASTDVQAAIAELDTEKSSTSHTHTLDGLSDVAITTPADNEVLAFDNSSGDWINQTASEAGLAAASHTHDWASDLTATSNNNYIRGDGAGGTEERTPTQVLSDIGAASATDLSNHLSDTTDAHDASAISFSAAGNIVATDVQAAIQELDTEKASDADLDSHTANTSNPHSVTAAQVNALALDASEAMEAPIKHHTVSGITASTTQTQGQGALTAEINEVDTVANANDTVTLPTAVAGLKITVINNGANTLQVFPASSDNLGDGVNNSTTILSGEFKIFYAYDSTNWEVVGASSAAGVSSIDDLSDVVITSLGDGEVLISSSGNWINQTAAEAGLATATSVSDHLSDASGAHAASAVSFSATGNISSTDVQAAIEELDTEKAASSHTHDWASELTATAANNYLRGDGAGGTEERTPSQVLSDIGGAASGHSHAIDDLTDVTITSLTDNEVLLSSSGSFINRTFAEADIASATDLSNHISDATAAHAGSAISFSPAGNIAATDVQAAIEELDTEKSSTSHTHAVNDLSDVTITTLGDGEFLVSSTGTFINQTKAEADIASAATLSSHTSNTSNPHSVTASQVGAPPTSRAITIAGTTNEITSSAGAQDLSADRTWTLSLPSDIDLSGKTSVKIPTSDTPTVDENGKIAIDTSVTDFSHGIVTYFGGEEMGVVAMPISEFTSPTDGHVVAYNSTTDEFELVAQSGGGGGASSLDDLTDVTIASLGDNEILLSSSGTFINQTFSEAGIASAASLNNHITVPAPTWEISEPGDTLSFHTGAIGDALGNSVNGIDISQIDDTHFLAVYSDATSGDGFAVVLAVNTSTWEVTTAGSEFEFDTADGISCALSQIDNTHYLLAYRGSGGDGFAIVLEVNTSTWAVSAAGSAFEFDTADAIGIDLEKVDDNHFIAVYGGTGEDGFALILEVNTSTWAVAAPGSSLEFDTVKGVQCKVERIDATHFFVTYWGPDDDGWSQVLEVNTSTWAITSLDSFEWDTTYGREHALVKLTDYDFVVVYRGTDFDGYAMLLQISRDDFSISAPGSSFEFLNGDVQTIGATRIDSEHILIFYGLSMNATVLEINRETGSITEVATPIQVESFFAVPSNAFARVDTEHYLFIYNNGSNGQATILEVDAITTAHDASAIRFESTRDVYSTNVQDAIEELSADIVELQNSPVSGVSSLDGLSDVTISSLGDNEILLSSSGTFINQTFAEADIATATSVSNHIGDSSGAHAASAISFSAGGNISATDVQAAIEELDDEKLTGTRRIVGILVSDPNGDALTTGDDKAVFRIPSEINGWVLKSVAASVTTASSSGTPTIQIRNATGAVDTLSTALTIDASETDSSTAATAAVINASNDNVATGDSIRIDVDTAGTGTKGLYVELQFAPA